MREKCPILNSKERHPAGSTRIARCQNGLRGVVLLVKEGEVSASDHR